MTFDMTFRRGELPCGGSTHAKDRKEIAMHEDKFIGKTLREVAKKSAQGSKGYVIFILRDAQDDTGKRISWCAKVGHLLHKYPGLAACKVKIAYDYYGETILRVLEEHRGKSKNVRNE